MELTLVYPLEAFELADVNAGSSRTAAPVVQPATIVSGPIVPIELDSLPAKVSDKLKALIRDGRDPDPNRFPSRSEAVASCVTQLLLAGVSSDACVNILLDPRYLIGERVRERKHAAADFARREVTKMAEFVSGNFDVLNGGQPVRDSQKNIRLAFHKLGVRVSFNDFSQRQMIDGLPGHGPLIDDNV